VLAQNICFVITIAGEQQIYAITDVGGNLLRWLEVLSTCIPDSSVTGTISAGDNGMHFGVFNYHEFRTLLKAIGYGDAITTADILYQKTK